MRNRDKISTRDAERSEFAYAATCGAVSMSLRGFPAVTAYRNVEITVPLAS
jgi:hypothetical protein